MTGYNQYSNIRSGYTKERFTDYDSLNAYLTDKGSDFKRAIPLYSIGSDGNDEDIIAHFGWQEKELSLGNMTQIIAPMGEIVLTKVTDGGFGIVSSVDDGTTITLTEGHTLPANFKARIFDVSAGAELFDDVVATVDENTLTLPATTGMAAGDLIYALGRSELTIGDSNRNILLTANSKINFVEAGMNQTGMVVHNWLNYLHKFYKMWLASYGELTTEGDMLGIGSWLNATSWLLKGVAHDAGTDINPFQITYGTSIIYAAAILVSAPYICLSPFQMTESTLGACICSALMNAASGSSASSTSFIGSQLLTSFTKGAVVSKIHC